MASLGSFGAAIRELDPDAERDTFTFFDRKFTVHGVIPPIIYLQLGAAMVGKISRLEANAAIWQALRLAMTKPAGDGDERDDDSEFDVFYQLAVRRRCSTDELLSLALTLVGAQGDLPTEQPDTSPGGRLPTSESSNSSSSDTPDSPRLRPVDEVLAG